jgi:DNA-binding transcriptional regulator YhcF (GntR family)
LNSNKINEIIKLEENAGTPKFIQLTQAINRAIENGHLEIGDKLPSVNNLSENLKISRDTVFAAYHELVKKGIVKVEARKGYYIRNRNLRIQRNIFLLFDELNAFKEDLYNAFLNEAGNRVKTDIFFHNFNHKVFCLLIDENIGKYTDYVIMPAGMKHIKKSIDKLPAKHTFLLDQPLLTDKQSNGVFQNFEQIVYEGLYQLRHRFAKYQKAYLIYPHRECYPEEIRTGFARFFRDIHMKYDTIDNLDGVTIEKGNMYMVIDDRELAAVVLEARKKNLIAGKDIGIVSYNEMHLKKVVDVGITTISTDFEDMGRKIAQMVINKEKGMIESTWQVYERNSL